MPVLSRPNERARSTAGLFVNMNPLRLSLDGDPTFSELLQQVKRELSRDFRHQRVSIGEINRVAGLPATGRKQLFDVTLSFERQDFSVRWGDAPSETRGLSANHEQSPLLISVRDFGHAERVWIDFEFNHAYLDGEDAEAIARHFHNLLHDIVERPQLRVSGLKFLDPDEETRIGEFARGPHLDTRGLSVQAQFEQHVVSNPDSPAVVHRGHVTTYRGLNDQANAIACALRNAHHIDGGDIVAIKLARSPRLVASILGILKAGAAYLPIDPSAPPARISAILEDAQCRVVLDEEWLEHASPAAVAPLQATLCDPDDLAYVIYTSGSTGAPKGCRITQRNLTNYLAWANRTFLQSGGRASFPLFSSIAFDFTITSILCPLTAGGSITVFDEEQTVDEALSEIFAPASGFEVVKLTPSHIVLLNDLDLAGTRVDTVVVGGEELTETQAGILRRINPRMRIVNEYGPTETTVGCIAASIEPDAPITIGKPIANTCCHVLDSTSTRSPLARRARSTLAATASGRAIIAGRTRPPRPSFRTRSEPAIVSIELVTWAVGS